MSELTSDIALQADESRSLPWALIDGVQYVRLPVRWLRAAGWVPASERDEAREAFEAVAAWAILPGQRPGYETMDAVLEAARAEADAYWAEMSSPEPNEEPSQEGSK